MIALDQEIGTDYEDSASAQRNAMALKLVKEKMKTQSKMMKAIAVDEANMTKALADHEVNGTKLHNLADDEVNLSWQVDQGLSMVEQVGGEKVYYEAAMRAPRGCTASAKPQRMPRSMLHVPLRSASGAVCVCRAVSTVTVVRGLVLNICA